ncbi:MAG: hypothetical protein ABJA89_04415 [Lapillicoccus sp.]
MPTGSPVVMDDRVLRGTRALSLFIAPFLVLAFVLLYVFPGNTERVFAWTITPTMTPMTLAAAYLGGAYYFVRAVRESRWTRIKAGLPAVTVFATLLGIATVLHWDRFNHAHPAFWLWTFLYATAPFLVAWAWLANRRYAAPATANDERVGAVARGLAALAGFAAFGWGVVMFVAPTSIIPLWPWALTPLTCRVLGAIFCLGIAGVWIAADPRWVAVERMLQVGMIMLAFIILAALRARDELYFDRPLTWVFLVGSTVLLIGAAVLWSTHAQHPKESRPGSVSPKRV